MTKHHTNASALLALLFTVVNAAPAFAQAFGYRTALAGDELIVTEPLNSTTPGAVYVYARDASGHWSQQAQLLASDAAANDYFGRSLAVEGSTMFIGATIKDNSTGAMYRFERDSNGSWAEAERFRPDDLGEGESFGRMAAMSGDIAAFAAWGHADGRGGVWVYERDGSGKWNQTARLTASDGAEQDFFGYSLTTDGNIVVVGAALRDRIAEDGDHSETADTDDVNDAEGDEAAMEEETETDPDVGAVYIFERDAAGDWQEHLVEIPWLDSNALFGWSVAVLDGDVLASAPGESGFTGTVYRLRRSDDGSWGVEQALQAFDGAPGAWFGSAISVADDAVWIGSQGANQAIGATYLLSYDDGSTITGISKLQSEGLEQGDNLGTFLTANGRLAIVTTGGSDYGLGAVRVFAAVGDNWTEQGELFVESTSVYEPIVGGRVDCSDGEARGFGCSDVDVISFLPLGDIGAGRGVTTNDVWGWTDPDTKREYALVGLTDATSFIDVTDAANPVYLGKLDRTSGAPGSSWRDIKVYANHAFIVSEAGAHGMQVFDLTQLRNMQGAPVEFEETAHYDGIVSAHNIVINEQSGFAFSVGSNGGGETCGGGLHMIDIRTPSQPTFAGCFADPNTGNAGTGYSHDAQCVIYHGPDADYQGREICIGSNETAISIADVTDKQNPIAITSATYPTVGYAHQGWFTEDQRYFFLDDEGDETNSELGLTATRTLIWDMQDLDDPILVKEYLGETLTIDHNLYINGDLMYQSNYVSGLRILDVSDPENPVEVGFFDTVPGDDSVVFDGSWSNYPFFDSGTIIVTSGSQGLFMLQKRDSQPVT